MAKVGFECGIGVAIRGRFPRGRGTEERFARGASVRLGSHTLRRPRLPDTGDKAVAGALIFVSLVAIGIEAIVYLLGP